MAETLSFSLEWIVDCSFFWILITMDNYEGLDLSPLRALVLVFAKKD